MAIVENFENLEKSVEIVVDGAMRNTGQGSHSIKNVFVHEEVYKKFKEKLVEKVLELRIGNQLDEGTDIGPVCVKNDIISGKNLVC